MTGRLSKAERRLLAELASHPQGAVVRGQESKDLVYSLEFRDPPLVDNIFEMPRGALLVHITPAGRTALNGKE